MFSRKCMRWVIVTVLVVPWLWPFAGGPSPFVQPRLVSLTCVSTLVLLGFWLRLDLPKSASQAWLLAALVSCLIGLLQYSGLSPMLAPWISVTPIGEAFGNLRQRNQFATLTNIGLAALLCSVTYWKSLSDEDPQKVCSPMADVSLSHLVWPGAAAVLLAVGNATSSSRTGMLQLTLMASLLLLWRRLRKMNTSVLVLVVALSYPSAAFLLPRLVGLDPSATGILARLNDSGPACASRLVLWRNVLELIAQKPWFGWGWGELGYAHFTTLYTGPRFCDILDNAHNLPLHLAVELGVPIAVLACGLTAWLVWRAKPWRETSPARQLAWTVLALIMLHSMLEYPLWYGPFQIAAGVCVWILWRTPIESEVHADYAKTVIQTKPPIAFRSRAASKVLGCISALLLAGVAYAAWDYHRISQIYLAPNMRSPAYRENTLEKINGSWLFRNQVRFAELTTSEVNPDNAAHINALAQEMLHFSPEARVAEKLVESAVMLGRDGEALLYLARYRAAFPQEHASWLRDKRLLFKGQLPSD